MSNETPPHVAPLAKFTLVSAERCLELLPFDAKSKPSIATFYRNFAPQIPKYTEGGRTWYALEAAEEMIRGKLTKGPTPGNRNLRYGAAVDINTGAPHS